MSARSEILGSLEPAWARDLPEQLPPGSAALPLVDERRSALLELARALHRHGAPAQRLEEALTELAGHLGIRAQFFSTPTALLIAFGENGSEGTTLLRVSPGDVNLEKLAEADALIEAVTDGRVTAAEAARIGASLIDVQPRYGPKTSVVSYSLVSASAACFFGGAVLDLAASFITGSLIAMLGLWAERAGSRGRVLFPLSGFIAAFLAGMLALAAANFGGTADLRAMSVYIVTLSSLIALIPGFSLTTGVGEIATGNLVSGSARLTGALVVFASLGFGVAFGMQVAGWFGEPPSPEVATTPWMWLAVSLIVAPVTFVVLFRAHPRDTGWIVAAGFVGFFGARTGAAVFGPELGMFLGALLLGIGSNAFARWRRRNATAVLLPGMMLLVPGSLGFWSLAALLDHDVLSGIETAFRMALVAVALVMGLLFANVVLPPRRAL